MKEQLAEENDGFEAYLQCFGETEDSAIPRATLRSHAFNLSGLLVSEL